MSMLMDPVFVAVKSEPQETEPVEHNFISDSPTIEHNIAADTSIDPLDYLLIEQKPQINDDGESNSTSCCNNNELDLNIVTSEISSPHLGPPSMQCSNTEFRERIEPKVEVDDEIARPVGLLVRDSASGEFSNELNYIDCTVEPTSHHCESNLSGDPLNISSPKQRGDQADELLKGKDQMNECSVSIRRLNIYSYCSRQKIKNPSCFKCRFCSKILVSSRGILRHEKMHTDRVVCDYCNADFVLQEALVKHIESKHSGLCFKCSVCDKMLTTRKGLRRHMGIHTKPYKCTHCDLSFANKPVLDNHLGSHLGKSFKCDQCDSSFGSSAYLRLHKNIHDPNRKSKKAAFKCSYCDLAYSQNKSLQLHIKEAHMDPKDFAFHCEFCGKSFATSSRYQDHRRDVHVMPRVQIYTCGICEKSYRASRELQFHLEDHATVKSYGCTKCGEYFSTVNNLKWHGRSHSNYKCDACERGFARKFNLTCHIMELHNKEESYQCLPCNKFFFSKRQLAIHKSKHGKSRKRVVKGNPLIV